MKLNGNLLDAWNAVGGLSQPSKMPCFSYSIPANKCITGGKLRNLKNSVCNKCYAFKGFYNYPNSKNALEKRYLSLNDPNWTKNMIFLISNLEHSGYMRFHDSGDLQSIEHLKNICTIASSLPDIKFWLPTKEINIVSDFIKNNTIPDNLIIRISGFITDQLPSNSLLNRLNMLASGVTEDKNKINCPASKQKNICLDCRACWDRNVKVIWYKKH